MWDLEDFLWAALATLFGILIIGLVGLSAYQGVGSEKLATFCLSKGYSEYRFRFSGNYCIKRVDGTDIVVSVDSLK